MGPCYQEPTTVFTQLQQRREHAVRHIPSCRELLWHSLTFNHNLRNALWRKFLGLCGGFQNPVTGTSRKPTKNPHTFKLVQRKFPNQTQRFHTKAHRYAVEKRQKKFLNFFSQHSRGPAGFGETRPPPPAPGGRCQRGGRPIPRTFSRRRPPRPPAAARALRRRRASDPCG